MDGFCCCLVYSKEISSIQVCYLVSDSREWDRKIIASRPKETHGRGVGLGRGHMDKWLMHHSEWSEEMLGDSGDKMVG